MGIKQMQGVSANLEYIGPHGRKRKKNCQYYNKEICHCNKSSYYLLKCGGRFYCRFYSEAESENDIKDKNNKEQLDNRKVKQENFIIYYTVTLLSLETQKIIKIEIVPADYANPFENKYSAESNFVKKLQEKVVGDIFTTTIAKRNKQYKIVSIE